ncbi:ATPase [Schlesneria sp. T3-172]|uniref:ATPase n=1 Tax=Schlesneria sphaerica TaxID=3373610 RepID=UPI0037CC1A0D
MPTTELFSEPIDTIHRTQVGVAPLGPSHSYPLAPVGAPPQANTAVAWAEDVPPLQAAPAPAPRSPRTVSDTGLSMGQLTDLLLKTLYVHGVLQGSDLSKLLRLPLDVVEEPLLMLRDQRLVEAGSGDVLGSVTFKFALTENGRIRAREAVENCRYVGPAPVPLAQYIEQCHVQSVAGTRCNPVSLRAAFKDYVIRPSLLDELGPAVCSGKSLFLYGPPGNGKTVIAKGLGRFLSQFCGEIYVPYAILADNNIITFYDPGIHQTTDDADQGFRRSGPNGEGSQALPDGAVDRRWRRIKRPVVLTGSELTLDLMELKYNRLANFYNAPMHIKANGGMFLIDDIGRQTISARDLLNRWTVPLEESADYLTLSTGRKCMLPLEQLTIFATNLDTKEVVDEAFLRRTKHKLQVNSPTRELYTVIFQMACRQRDIAYDEAIVNTLFENYYDRGRAPRASDPRDLLEMARSICRFHEVPVNLSIDLIHECAKNFFGTM